MLNMIVSGDGDVPIFIETGSGNQSDKKVFGEIWIFQCFQGIHLVEIQGIKQISNLNNSRQFTLKFFPLACQKYYILSG